jgi:hypothetical protein
MNWRRGLLLAGIHVAVGTVLIYWQERRIYHEERGDAGASKVSFRFASWQEEPTVNFDPCHGGFVEYYVPPAQRVVQSANMPAWILTGWGNPCPSRFTLAGILETERRSDPLRAEMIIAISLGLLIPIQWLLVGAFPLLQPRRWWAEPGAFITLTTVLSAVLAIPSMINSDIGYALELPLLFIPFAWLWWFGLLLWKPAYLAWDSTLHGLRRLSN